jgi:hypothetical protein
MDLVVVGRRREESIVLNPGDAREATAGAA